MKILTHKKQMEIAKRLAAIYYIAVHWEEKEWVSKDGWLNLQKEVMRMGGYAIHELPLKNPSIAVIIPAEEGE